MARNPFQLTPIDIEAIEEATAYGVFNFADDSPAPVLEQPDIPFGPETSTITPGIAQTKEEPDYGIDPRTEPDRYYGRIAEVIETSPDIQYLEPIDAEEILLDSVRPGEVNDPIARQAFSDASYRVRRALDIPAYSKEEVADLADNLGIFMEPIPEGASQTEIQTITDDYAERAKAAARLFMGDTDYLLVAKEFDQAAGNLANSIFREESSKEAVGQRFTAEIAGRLTKGATQFAGDILDSRYLQRFADSYTDPSLDGSFFAQSVEAVGQIGGVVVATAGTAAGLTTAGVSTGVAGAAAATGVLGAQIWSDLKNLYNAAYSQFGDKKKALDAAATKAPFSMIGNALDAWVVGRLMPGVFKVGGKITPLSKLTPKQMRTAFSEVMKKGMTSSLAQQAVAGTASVSKSGLIEGVGEGIEQVGEELGLDTLGEEGSFARIGRSAAIGAVAGGVAQGISGGVRAAARTDKRATAKTGLEISKDILTQAKQRAQELRSGRRAEVNVPETNLGEVGGVKGTPTPTQPVKIEDQLIELEPQAVVGAGQLNFESPSGIIKESELTTIKAKPKGGELSNEQLVKNNVAAYNAVESKASREIDTINELESNNDINPEAAAALKQNIEAKTKQRKLIAEGKLATAITPFQKEDIGSGDALAAPSYGYPPTIQTSVNDLYTPQRSGTQELPGLNYTPPTAEEIKKGTNTNVLTDSLVKIQESIGDVSPVRQSTSTQSLKRRKAAGVFYTRPSVIRTLTHGDVSTQAHEVAHSIEQTMFGKKNPWETKSKDMQKELTSLGKELYGDRKPSGGMMREGWAEFFRKFLDGSDPKLLQKAPNTYKWFADEFLKTNPKLEKEVLASKRKFDVWRQQSPATFARQQLVEDSSLLNRIRDIYQNRRHIPKQILDTFLADWVESGKVFDEIVAEVNEKIPDSEASDLSDKFQALRNTAGGRTAYMLEKGMIDFDGQVVGRPLQDAIDLIPKGKEKDFTVYLWAKRAKALWQDPKGPRNPGIPLEMADSLIESLDSNEFALAADRVYEWQAGLMRYVSQASPMFADLWGRIQKRDPGFYVPLEREFNSLNKIYGSISSSGEALSRGNILKGLKGSGRRVKNPLDTMIQNANKMVEAAHSRHILDKLIQVSEYPDMGRFVVKIPRDQIPQYATELGNIISKIEPVFDELGLDLKAMSRDGEMGDLSNEEVQAMLDTVITFFGPTNVTPKGQENFTYIPYYGEDGKLSFYEVDKRVYDTVMQVNPYKAGKMFNMLIATPNKYFRMGTTGARLSFGIVTNTLRDARTAQVLLEAKSSNKDLFLSYIPNAFNQFLSSVTNQQYQDKLANWAARNGLGAATPLGQDKKSVEAYRKQMFKKGFSKVLDVRNIFDYYTGIVQTTEIAARKSAVELRMRELGITDIDQVTPEQNLQLMLTFKRATVDFTAAGRLGRIANQMIPFFNANVQSKRSAIRAMNRDPKLFFWRLAQGALVSAGLWWQNKDEEWWKETDALTKALFTLVPVEVGDEKILMKIPRAFELDGISMFLFESIADSVYREDPKFVKDWFKTFMHASNPIGSIGADMSLPVFFDEIRDQLNNKDNFFGTPIVPKRFEMGGRPVADEEQYTRWTSETAKALGSIFGESPLRIDHAIRGIFGGAASDAINFVETLAGLKKEPLKPSDDFSDIPIIGVLFNRGGQVARRPVSISKFYDRYEKVIQKREKETSEDKALAAIFRDASRSISALRFLQNNEGDSTARQNLQNRAVKIAKEALEIADSDKPAARYKAKFRGRAKKLKRLRDIAERD